MSFFFTTCIPYRTSSFLTTRSKSLCSFIPSASLFLPYPLPLPCDQEKKLNCCRVFVNTAHWMWYCLHMGVAPWVSVGFVTRVNAVGSHMESLTQHSWKTMKSFVFNAINWLWVWHLTPRSPWSRWEPCPWPQQEQRHSQGFWKKLAEIHEKKMSRGWVSDTSWQTGEATILYISIQKEVGPVAPRLTRSMNISKIKSQTLQSANSSPALLHLPWKILLGLLLGKRTSHHKCQNTNPEWEKDQ